MADLEIKRSLDEVDVAEVEHLIDRVVAADGLQPIDEHRWIDAAHGGRSEFSGLVLREAGHDHLVAYAQVTRGEQSWAIDLMIDPHHRWDALLVGPRLLDAALAVIRAAGGGHVHWWVYEPTHAHASIAEQAGFGPGRELYQMRVPLPLADGVERGPSVVTRPFRVGEDEEAWLAVNNAAFAWHPEQGGWTLADVRDREAEDWFDADGFLLLEEDGDLLGSCWTKVHADTGLGEIYVISVHPDATGRGLGRALTVAGLEHLATRVEDGMLYVDAENTPAVALYRSLGFRVHHSVRAFVGDV